MVKWNIGVVGLWHLGCVLCASWTKLGHKVVGLDFRDEVVSNLSKGIPPLFEPGLESEIRRANDDGLLSFSADERTLRDCDFVFIAYDTPVREDDTSDVTLLTESVRKIAPFLRDQSIVIVSSQSPVGLCSSMRSILQNENSAIELVYSPENLRLGEAINCYLNPGRIILGSETESAKDRAVSLFREIPGEIIAMDLASAEMVKHGINSFLATCITFANHLADVCEYSGADISQVVKGMKSDPRIGAKAYLSPGIGFSGGTLGRDLKVLEAINKRNNGMATLFGQIHQSNALRKNAIVAKIEKLLGGTASNKQIGILGVTYKPGTSTLRRSLPIEIVQLLQSEGARVVVHDPKADYSELIDPESFTVVTKAVEAFDGSDIVVLLTEWPEFNQLDWEELSGKMRSPILFDTKNALDSIGSIKAFFQYHGVGK